MESDVTVPPAPLHKLDLQFRAAAAGAPIHMERKERSVVSLL